jgi:predicted transposase YdaD
MRESVVYQELREEIVAMESLYEARSLVLRQLACRVGVLPEAIQAQVETLPLERMETLGEDLLDFSDLADLENWLA